MRAKSNFFNYLISMTWKFNIYRKKDFLLTFYHFFSEPNNELIKVDYDIIQYVVFKVRYDVINKIMPTIKEIKYLNLQNLAIVRNTKNMGRK